VASQGTAATRTSAVEGCPVVRRRMLNHLLRPDALTLIREEIIIPASEQLLAQRLRMPSVDGLYRMDLVEFRERVFPHFTAKLIGLVDVDSDEQMAELRTCAGPLAAGASSQFLDDRTAINEVALAAKRRYVEEFYNPSRGEYERLRTEVAAGRLDRSEIPVNIMSLIADGADPAYLDDDKAVVGDDDDVRRFGGHQYAVGDPDGAFPVGLVRTPGGRRAPHRPGLPAQRHLGDGAAARSVLALHHSDGGREL
jgi:hypothetical protein